MKPHELYNREPEYTSYDLRILRGYYYNHVPEIEETYFYYSDTYRDNKRVQIKIYKEFDFDGRRFWRLAGVFFDNYPIMIIQNAGREGDDHSKRFVTSPHHYPRMINYIQSLADKSPIDDIFDINEDIENLDYFYDHKLDGKFNWFRE